MFRQMAKHMIYSLSLLLTLFCFVENEIHITGPHVLIENRELRITCNASEQIGPEGFRWVNELGKDMTSSEDFGKRVQIQNVGQGQSTLVFVDAIISDVGNYSCVHRHLNATTRVRSKPMLCPFEEYQTNNYKSANIVEGQRFSLRCALAKGFERDARLEWYIYPEDEASSDHLLIINTSDPRISIESNDSSVSVLTINGVQPADRYFYVCKSHNDVTSFNNTILLRVKDKLAALWPFLGIVCEVLILCIIIFVYEKRRVKPDFDEPDNHRKDEGNWSPPDRASRSQDLRQRK